MKRFFVAAFLFCTTIAKAEQVTLYVDGLRGEGSYLTLSEAIKEASEKINHSDVRVVIKEGVYQVKSSIVLPKSGGGHRLTIEAEKGAQVTLFGGDRVPAEWFSPLTAGEFADRLVDKRAREKILVCDLSKHGIKELGEITTQGWNKHNEGRIAPPIVTIAGKRMTLARWPNAEEKSPYLVKRHYTEESRELVGYELVVQEIIDNIEILGEVGLVSVVDRGAAYNPKSREQPQGGTFAVAFNRMKYWGDPTNIFVDGVFNSTWEWTYNKIAAVDLKRRHITLSEPELRPLGKGESVRLPHMHFDNIPEEIDSPGEYYIDRKSGLLYLYPPTTYDQSDVILATLSKPMIEAQGVTNVTIKGLRFDTGRGLALDFSGAQGVQIEGCTISNFVGGGIDLHGANNTVSNCLVYGIGATAISISGGDFKTLKGGANVVSSCEIHDFGWDQKSQMPGVMVQGVAHRVEHCDIYDGTHFAVRLKGVCDVIVEYNKIHNLPTYHFFDGGALYHYSGTNPEMRGNEIRHNYFHDIPTIGVYPDNYTWGDAIYGNLFYRVGVEASRPAVYVNGGGDNRTYNNVMVDCPLIYNQGRHPSAFNMKRRWQESIDCFAGEALETTPYKKYDDFRAWLTNEDLQSWLSGEPSSEPKRPFRGKSYLYKNLMYNPTVKIYNTNGATKGVIDRSEILEQHDNYISRKDPGFVDAAEGDFNLKADFDLIEGFEPIEFDKMGLKR